METKEVNITPQQAARMAKNEYMRQYRQKNKEKLREQNKVNRQRYWEKKGMEMLAKGELKLE